MEIWCDTLNRKQTKKYWKNEKSTGKEKFVSPKNVNHAVIDLAISVIIKILNAIDTVGHGYCTLQVNINIDQRKSICE